VSNGFELIYVNGFVENFGASDLAAIAGDVLASLGMPWTTF
jgi:hypothetical protein